MIKSNIQRQKAVDAAVGSVRAEGLKPSKQIQQDLKSYANGKTSLETVRKATILRIANTRQRIK